MEFRKGLKVSSIKMGGFAHERVKWGGMARYRPGSKLTAASGIGHGGFVPAASRRHEIVLAAATARKGTRGDIQEEHVGSAMRRSKHCINVPLAQINLAVTWSQT